MKKLGFFLVLCSWFSVAAQNKVVVYPLSDASITNADFSTRVRVPGGKWQTLPNYTAKVAAVENYKKRVEKASQSYFAFEGEVEVEVTYRRGSLSSARIRPLSYGIVPDIVGNTLRFSLKEARNLSVEVNGEIFHNLHLFANATYKVLPDPKDPTVMYFGPGVHRPEGKKVLVPSGKTVYVDGGAYVDADFVFDGVKNAKLFGHGLLNQDLKGVRIAHSQNISVEGLLLSQCFTGGSENVNITNVKAISHVQWGDGMNVIASNNVTIDGVFNRNSDDCTTVYGTRLGFVGSCNNITMKNSTLWADVAHPILIGTHGNTPEPEILQNLNYINLDILDHNEAQLDYQGVMSVNAGDSNLIRDVRFEDIRVEDFRQGQLVNVRVFYNSKYCTSPGRGVENIVFKNISYTGKNAEVSVIEGYDEQRKVKNVVFENLQVNGLKITDTMPGKPGYYKTSDVARIFQGNHVEGVVFK
jgi:hypothetical protein